MAVDYQRIQTEFERLRDYVTRDLDLVTRQTVGGNYLAAALLTCACDAIAYLKFGKPHRGDLFFEELLPTLWQPVAKDLYDAIRNGIVHVYDTKLIAIGARKLDLAISWGVKPHLNLSAGGDAVYINVQQLATDLKNALGRFETDLKNDAGLRDVFYNSMRKGRELYPGTRVEKWEELLEQAPRYTEGSTQNDGIYGEQLAGAWQQLQDPENIENRNAGNGGDLVKHAVYLTVWDYLLAREPWSTELRVRECHAGRGMYGIPRNDLRRGLLECLYDPAGSDVGIPLHDLQRGSQQALGVWPKEGRDLAWYSGSAVLNAWRLSHGGSGKRLLELYEFAPKTRDILRALFGELSDQLGQTQVRILPEPEDGREFDGEAYIEQNISNWDARDVVLLDPFAMWRQDEHQRQRNRYRSIVDQLIKARNNSPSLMLFWTWGRAFPVAEADLEGGSNRVRNGYQDLRESFHSTSRRFIRVSWRWGLQFAMWILVPESHLSSLATTLQVQCNALRDHLLAHGCKGRLSSPDVQVVVD